MRAVRVHTLQDIAHMAGISFKSAKHAWKHRHQDEAVTKPKKFKVGTPTAMQKTKFLRFRKNQPSYNQPVSTRPVRSMLTKLHYENKTGIMKWIFKDILRLSALPKMVMVEALKLYENGQRVLGPYHYKQA